NAPVIKAAQEAALRLCRNQFSWDQRRPLIDALETLGMTDESKRLFSMPLPASRQYSVNSVVPKTRALKPVKDRVEILVEAGRKEEAIRMLLKELKNAARSLMSSRNMTNTILSSQWKDRVTRLGL